jgi:tetratricopeptide (TPR) repeat protein
MKALRWIISHLLLLVLIWTAVYVYLDWENVKQDLPESVTEWVAGLTKMAEGTNQATTEPVATSSSAVEETMPAQPESEETVVVAEEPPTVPVAESATEAPLEAETVEQQVEISEVAQEQAEASPVAPVAGSVTDDQTRTQLIEARNAFWARDMDKAIEVYNSLASTQPDNPDLWGELGNVYMAANKPEGAVEAYARAAEILIEKGNLQQIGKLIQIIGRFDQDKARVLHEQAMSKQPEQPYTR